MKMVRVLLLLVFPLFSYGQLSRMTSVFDYKNINSQTFIPMQGWNEEQKYMLTVLKHSFEMQHIISSPSDTIFFWNGLVGEKTMYHKDSLLLFFVRPADTLKRPCILLSHGNNARYRSSWNENMNFYAIDLAMRGYCVAYYENPSSQEAKAISAHVNGNFNQLLAKARNAFYYGFQSAAAADVFVRHHEGFLNIDTTHVFAGGYSFGAFCSLMLATSDTGINFTDTLFEQQGGFTSRALYNDPYSKNISHVFSIGGGLPKDDTIPLNNSHMGNFLEEHDSALAILFLHGRTDNFVSFDLTRFIDTIGSADFFWGEGPRALTNRMRDEQMRDSSKLFVNCRGGHGFLTSVCGYSNPYCLPQYQWQYLAEPMGDLSSNNSYYQDPLTDTLLHYFAYMMTQINDIGLVIGDFLQPSILNTVSAFPDHWYFIQPRDSFTYVNSSGHYIVRNTDCEGHSLVITDVKQNPAGRSSFLIYPNPGNKSINISANEPMEKISIYSIIGSLVKSINGVNRTEQEMDIRDLEPGEYICTVQLREKLRSLKFCVIH